MSTEAFERFMSDIKWTTSPVLIRSRKSTLKYAKQRKHSTTLGDEARFVNVAGGAKEGLEVAEATSWLNTKGFGKFVDVVAGPLFRATSGHQLTHMPYSPKSSHVHLIPAMRDAFGKIKASGRIDPEYDPSGDPTPKFANHSNRRHADRVAMRHQKETEVTDEDINFFFGWELKKMDEKMALHYRGLDRVMRLGLSKVTSKM